MKIILFIGLAPEFNLYNEADIGKNHRSEPQNDKITSTNSCPRERRSRYGIIARNLPQKSLFSKLVFGLRLEKFSSANNSK